MGCSASRRFGGNNQVVPDSASQANEEINRILAAEKERMRITTKLLLLGPGGAGKTTILKQIRLMYCDGFSEEERLQQKNCIQMLLVRSVIIVAEFWLSNANSPKVQMNEDEKENHCAEIDNEASRRDDQLAEMREIVAKLSFLHLQNLAQNDPENYELSVPIVDMVKVLLLNDRLKEFLERGGKALEGVVPEYDENGFSNMYWLDDVKRICAQDYLPTIHDLILQRKPTLVITELEFSRQEQLYKVIDVSGQKGERRKWIAHFDDCKGLIFFASLSDYNLVMPEDAQMNRMKDALQLFQAVYSYPYFTDTSIILFLNKRDLFDIKLKAGIRLKDYFRKYKGDNTYASAVNFIQDMFCGVADAEGDTKPKDIYCHRTCATQTDHVANVLGDCFTMVLKLNLERTGMA